MLVKAGYQVGVVTSELRSLKNWSSIFSLNHGTFYENDHNIRTVRFKTMYWFPKMPTLIRSLSLIGGKIALERYIKKFGKPDLIHVHSCLYMGELAIYASLKYKIPYVVTEHSSGYFRKIYNQQQLDITRSIFENSNANIAVSKKMANYLSKNIYSDKEWNVIPNIVDSNFLSTELLNKKNKKFKFLNVAFMNENKKQLNLIKAFEKLKNSGVDDIELILVGDGEEKITLVNYVNVHEIKDVLFLGKKNRKEISEIMIHCDCFVLSSQFETFGVVLIEALASGMPLISTKCGGPEDIVNESNGILVEPDNVEELTLAMRELKNSIQNYNKIDLRKECEEIYSESSILKKLSKLYQNSSI